MEKKEEQQVMTYRDLKDKLDTLEEWQLDQRIGILGDEKFFRIKSVWILEEDYINPSGECIEPVSAYADDPEYADEEVVCPKGTVFLDIAE